MTINTTTLEANLTTKINATSGTTDGKEFLLLGKAVEALTIPASVSAMTTAGTTQVGLVTTEGTTQVAAVQAAGSNYLTIVDPVVSGSISLEEVYEKVTTATSTTGTIAFDTTAQGVEFYTADQTANRTINFSNVNANLAIGKSVTCAVLMTQGSTAYYLNAYQVDGGAVTPKWQGGEAPTEGNASSIDSYGFTIIKTADATFTVLASQTQFA
jgi:hypothetical protein